MNIISHSKKLVYNNKYIDINKMYNPSRSYDNMSPYSYQPKIQMPTQNQTSIALFHIPSDAKNSIYVDGVPNDAT